MLAHLAEALGDTQMAVRIGKSAIARGLNLIYYAYPVHRLPATRRCAGRRRPPSSWASPGRRASSTRTTLSGAGARGILQVMPITARHVCRDYKLKCDIPRLMKDAAYNTMMGSAYISDRMDEFSGSYVLTLAGYNAGPGRAREWIREFGDPRDSSVDPIDWIHRIPFEETRDYVQKVLSNIQIYRARLGEEANAVRLNADLKRDLDGRAEGTREAPRQRRRAPIARRHRWDFAASACWVVLTAPSAALLRPNLLQPRRSPCLVPSVCAQAIGQPGATPMQTWNDIHFTVPRRSAALCAPLSRARLGAAAGACAWPA